MDRRRYLGALAGGMAAVAGCTGGADPGSGSGSGSDGGNGDGNGGTGATPGGGTPVRDHPAAAALDAQPRRGELGGGRHVLIAFEDPSCPRCARFEGNVVPEIIGKLVEPGKAAFVYRNYPVVYDWGEPAVRALEATYDRSEPAFRGLKGHYFANQDKFGGDGTDPLAGAREYLDRETDLDGAAVASDAESGAYDDAVQADLSAGKEAGAGSTTPTVFIFRDGRYASKASGLVGYDLIAAALDE